MKSGDTGRLAWVMSAFSFRWGTDTPEALAEAARRAGCTGILMTDMGGVYGMIRLASACRRLEVGTVPGARLALPGGALTVGALEGGWGQLCRLVTASHLPGRVNPAQALEDSDRLFAVARPGAEDAVRLRTDGFRGRIYLPVPPGTVLPELPAGTLPLPARPWMFAGSGSPRAHEILRSVDRLLERPWVSGEPRPDNRMPVSLSDSWPPGAVQAGRELIERASGEPLERPYDPPETGPDDPGCLRTILLRRLGEMYPGAAAAKARLDLEFEALAGARLCGYFLVFHEIVSYCRENGILAVARGSAGGSLVARLLGLSVVCPIRYGLSFHRFFNPLRSRPPDIDLDIDSARRDQVFNWFLKRWGARAAAVSVLGTYRSRSAVRFAAAAAGMGPEEVEVLARASGNPDDPVWKRGDNMKVLREAGLLKGLPAGIGPHPCGLVVCNGPVESRVPVQGCSGGMEVTQFDKDGVEYMGLLKMDLLGHRGLSALASAAPDPLGELASVQNRLDEPARLLLSRGRTIGVPHVESPAMRGLLRETNPSGVEDVARALALVRPGASAGGGRERYAAGGDPRTPSCLSNLLRENRGVMLYQEDVSEAACVLLGLAPDRGDLMRRRLKAGSANREEITALCLAAGHSPDTAAKGWELLSGYAGYGFCKAHAVTYAVEACAFAGLKTRSPARAMAAFMAAGGGFYNPRVYVEEARRMGIGILPPGVNTGDWLCSPAEDGSLMLGFSLIRGMGSGEYGKLLEGRPHRSPASVRDAGIGRALASVMAAAGCFDEMGLSRSEAAWAVSSRGSGLFPEGVPPPPLPGYTREYRVLSELEAMGVTTEVHPLEILERPPGTLSAGDPPREGRYSLWGRAAFLRSLGGGAGFVMLEDPTGVADVYLPSPLYREAERILRRPGATLVLGCTAGERGRVSALEAVPGPVLG